MSSIYIDIKSHMSFIVTGRRLSGYNMPALDWRATVKTWKPESG